MISYEEYIDIMHTFPKNENILTYINYILK